MPTPGCPEWDYETHPRLKALFPQRIADLITAIYTAKCTAVEACSNSRPIHCSLFTDLTPPKHPYYSGHYRGERDCLIGYEVHIQAADLLNQDPMVGSPSFLVPHEMARYGKLMAKQIKELAAFQRGAILMDPVNRMATIVRFACHAFVTILTIHPFVNGNGHVARALLWIILFHFGYAVPLWTIDPRPPFPEYSAMIAAHRRNNVDLLEQFVISTIAIVDNSVVLTRN